MADSATWRARVKAWRASGQTAGSFAAGKGFAEGTLRWWAWKLAGPRAGALEAPRVVRVVPRAERASEAVAREARGLAIEVGRVRVIVGAGVDRTLLREVLAQLVDLTEHRRP